MPEFYLSSGPHILKLILTGRVWKLNLALDVIKIECVYVEPCDLQSSISNKILCSFYVTNCVVEVEKLLSKKIWVYSSLLVPVVQPQLQASFFLDTPKF